MDLSKLCHRGVAPLVSLPFRLELGLLFCPMFPPKDSQSIDSGWVVESIIEVVVVGSKM